MEVGTVPTGVATGTLSIQLRPRCLNEVIGHTPVVEAIRRQLASGRIPIAWLFSGPPGVGKTTLALIVARELGGDVREVNGASFGVDEARQLVEDSNYCPLSGQRRVFIIDEAQKATDAAQQQLLKPLENASGAVWIVCTTDPSKIIKPLRDRCLSFQLGGLSDEEIRTLLAGVLEWLSTPFDWVPLYDALVEAEIRSPREILMAAERLMGGMPAQDAVLAIEEENTEYIEIARAAVKGDWSAVAAKLRKLKPADAVPLRVAVVNYLLAMMRNSGAGPSTDTISDCIQGAFKYASLDALARAGTEDWLYRVCKKKLASHRCT